MNPLGGKKMLTGGVNVQLEHRVYLQHEGFPRFIERRVLEQAQYLIGETQRFKLIATSRTRFDRCRCVETGNDSLQTMRMRHGMINCKVRLQLLNRTSMLKFSKVKTRETHLSWRQSSLV